MNPNTAPHLRTPAPYGRACISCAQAKSKCITSDSVAGRCERCHRLCKECIPQPAVRKRRIVNSTPSTKTARLEEKLDGLVSLLQSASKALPNSSGNDAAGIQINLPSDPFQSPKLALRGQNKSFPDDLELHPLKPIEASFNVGYGSTIQNSAENLIPRGYEPSVAEASDNLKTFKVTLLKHFPFITIPEPVNDQELRQERPFLWLCIMAVSSKSSVQHVALGKEIRTIIGRQLLLEGERHLDLLLGLLIYVSWDQVYQTKPIIGSLMQLAVGLLVDLGLNKSPPKDSPHMMLNYDARGCPRPFNPSVRTMEERRTAIACYLLTATISSYFQKLDPPRWTAYLDECLQKLTESDEFGTDRLLVCLVQLQLITDKIYQASWQDGTTRAPASRAPAIFYLKALKEQLEDFQNTIPVELQQNETLLLRLHSTTLSLHEYALSRSSAFPSNSTDPLRLDSLYACLHATKSWFDIFLAIPSAQYIGFSTAILTQMAHCIIALYRLSTFSDPSTGWNVGLVRETIDFSMTLGKLMDKIGHVREEAGLEDDGTEENNIWYSTERRMGHIKSWWDGKVLVEERNFSTVGPMREYGGPDGGMMTGEFWDESWLDILGLRDYQF